MEKLIFFLIVLIVFLKNCEIIDEEISDLLKILNYVLNNFIALFEA